MILKRANAWIEKWIAFVTPTCLLLGVLFPEIAGRGVAYVPVVFAFMTFTGALKSSFKDIGKAAAASADPGSSACGHAVCRMERRRDVLCRKSGADHRNGS